METFIRYLEKSASEIPNKGLFLQYGSGTFTDPQEKTDDQLSQAQIARFLADLATNHHDWQVQQAQDALRLYLYFQSQTAKSTQDVRTSQGDRLWSDAVAQMVDALRLKHLSMRTEQTYLSWMRQFYWFVKAVAPRELNSRHVTEFLTYLGVKRPLDLIQN